LLAHLNFEMRQQKTRTSKILLARARNTYTLEIVASGMHTN
jgi:hypothetical protein